MRGLVWVFAFLGTGEYFIVRIQLRTLTKVP